MDVIKITTLKKGLIIGGISTLFVGGGGGLFYIINNYSDTVNTSTSIAANKKAVLPNSTNVSVTVNTVLDGAKKPEASTVLPPIKQISSAPPALAKLISNPPLTANSEQISRPHMLIVGDDDTAASGGSSAKNAISGTDTSVGTNEIDSKLTTQHSPFTIFAGTFIPATLKTAMNSDLSGELVASVRNDVYDSIDGKYLLIPQGSRLVGTYNHDVAYAQNRLMVGWNRVIYPNGASFLLRGQPGTDLSGMSGFTGDVDNHYDKIFGAAFMMGLITGTANYAAGNQSTNPYQLSAGGSMVNALGAQLSQAGVQVVQKGLNVAPTIIIPAGYRFNVLTTADLILKPYVYR